MGVANPALLWVVAAAAAGTMLLHLLSWRRPRPRLLPTARFLGTAAHPSRFRRVEPTDVSVLALRLVALVAMGAAVAGPLTAWRRDGTARVVVVDRSRAVASPAEVRDSVRALLTGTAATRIVAFDSIAVVTSLDGLGSATEPGEARGNLAAGLVAAIREGTELAAAWRTVEVVVVSPAVMEEGSPALAAIAATWPGERRLVRVGARLAAEPAAVPGAALPAATDPIGAATRLAWGGAPAHLRLARDGVTLQDSAFARAGGTLVVWARADTAGAPAAALATGDVAAVGAWRRTAITGAGAAIAHWHDGSPAAWESAIGTGCIREVGVGVPARGDAILRPAFLSLVRAVTRPCAGADLRPLDDASLAWLQRRAGTRGTATAAGTPNVLLQRVLLALALVALGIEWWVRGRARRAAGDALARAGAGQRVA